MRLPSLKIAGYHKSVMAFVAVKRATLRFADHQTTPAATVNVATVNIKIGGITLLPFISFVSDTYSKMASDLITYF